LPTCVFRKPFYFDEKTEETIEAWTPVTNASDIRMLQVDKEIKMIQLPNVERLRFWNNLNLKDCSAWTTL